MDKQKQIDKDINVRSKMIEEMARELREIQPLFYASIAEQLYNAGYRKIYENAVVIEKSEYEKLRLLADECLEWRRKNCNVGELPKENAVVLTREEYERHKGFSREEVDEISETAINNSRNETAEKFAERLKEKLTHPLDYPLRSVIDEICKEITEGK